MGQEKYHCWNKYFKITKYKIVFKWNHRIDVFFKILFIFCLCWVFVAARRLSLVAAWGGYSSLQCAGFSLQWLLLLQSTGSRHAGFSSCGTWHSSCGSQALELRLSSCGARALLLCSMWDLPGPRHEPMCPALAGRFLTTAPPGKSRIDVF